MRAREEIISSLDSLRKQGEEIREKIKEAERELAEVLTEFQIGQRVIMSYARKETEYEISKVDLWWGYGMRYFGRKVLKNGGLHKTESVLYGELKPKEASHD